MKHGAANGRGPEVELADQRMQRRIGQHGPGRGVGQRGAPDLALLLDRRPLDREADQRAIETGTRLAREHRHRSVEGVADVRRVRRALSSLVVDRDQCTFDHRFALHQLQQASALGAVAQIDATQDHRCPPELGAGECEHAALGRGVAAPEADDGPIRPLRRRPQPRDAVRVFALAGGQVTAGRQRICRRQQAHEVAHAGIDLGDADDRVQHTFVDAQRAGQQGLAGLQFDQAPAAQRGLRGERAPVGVRQHRQREAEAGMAQPTVALGLGAGCSKTPVEFDRCGQQQHLAFERRQLEQLCQPVELRRAGFRRLDVTAGRTARMGHQPRVQRLELGDEQALVGIGVETLPGVHVTLTRGDT